MATLNYDNDLNKATNGLIESFYSELTHEWIILVIAIIALIYIKKDIYIIILAFLFFFKLVIGLSIIESYDPQCSIPGIACPAVSWWWNWPAYDVWLYALLISLAWLKLIILLKNKWMRIWIGILSIALWMYAVYFFIKWWPIGYYKEMMSDINYNRHR
jgi:hypothetical protein